MSNREFSRARLVLIEGLPGSGKTSLADWLCSQIEAQGTAASWVSELQEDHPVIDRPTMRNAEAEGYSNRCVERWAAFSKDFQALESPSVLILEGCLFQSTVRFLVEYERPTREIEEYLPAVEGWLAPLRPHLVYLTQADVESYLEGEIVRRKGSETVSRISQYSATTPFSISRGLQGHSALVSLYTTYRQTCDHLVQRSGMPTLELDAVQLSEAEVRDRVGQWVAAAVAT